MVDGLVEGFRSETVDVDGWADVTVAVIADGQHYLVEERPDDVVALIEQHTARG
jgi:hypothetical protein